MHPKFLVTVVVILLTTPLWSSVGNVDIHEGNGEIERDTGDKFITELDLEIFMSDTVKTGNGLSWVVLLSALYRKTMDTLAALPVSYTHLTLPTKRIV